MPSRPCETCSRRPLSFWRSGRDSDQSSFSCPATISPSPSSGRAGVLVVETRQGLIEPQSNEFPIEHSLVVEHDGGTHSIGGPGSFLETFEAQEVTLEPGAED